MKKKIGTVSMDKTLLNGKCSTPIWTSIFTYNNSILTTVYFTTDKSPRFTNWYKELGELGFKIIVKGSWRFGYYYKIIITKPIKEMQKIIDILNKINYKDLVFNFEYTIEEIYRKFVLDSI